MERKKITFKREGRKHMDLVYRYLDFTITDLDLWYVVYQGDEYIGRNSSLKKCKDYVRSLCQ